jgi:aquaporin related protein
MGLLPNQRGVIQSCRKYIATKKSICPLIRDKVALGMCLIGALSWTRGLVIFIAQLLASIVSAEVVSALFPGPMIVQTRLGPGTSKVRGMFIEMFLTAGLVFTIFMLAVEKHKATFLAPVGISLAFFIAELSGMLLFDRNEFLSEADQRYLGLYYTGASLNPARSFGPNVVLANFPGSSWIYWVGPLLGSLLAVGFFKIVKFLEYENVNPDQDGGGDFDHMADVIEAQQRKHTEASSTPTIETCVQPQRPVAYFRSDSNNTTVVGGSVSRPDGMYSLEEQPEEGSRDSRMDDRMEDHIERTESAYSQGPAMESGELDHIEHASDS